MRLAFVAARTIHHATHEAAVRRHRLATELAERGHDVVCLTSPWWEGDFESFDREGVTYRGIAGGRGPVRATRLANAVRNWDPDVVHVAGGRPWWTAGAAVGATLARAGLLLEWYDPPEPAGAVGNWLRRQALRSAGAVVAPSQTVRTAVRELGVGEETVSVIPTGIDLDRIRRIEPADGGDIVFSRRLDEGANLETLLLALAEFREYDWRATIVGDGPRRDAYERQARDLRIEDRVEFVGDLPVEDRIALFKNAHVYVHTAEYTPFATDLLRALAAGCVSIVEYHEASSAHELVVHEDRGFTATSPEELTERLAIAGQLPAKDFEESFRPYDREAFLEAYLERYRALVA
ncbi:MAG: glycosyltransferase [Halodesulfurarchaeum sp.]